MKKENNDPYIDHYKRLGKVVRHLRKNRTNLDYISFAETIGLNKKSYYRIERGYGDYHISSLLKIITYYGNLSLEEFFKMTEL
ncbi:MAG: helix-turn-helix domain-containing protein [bacterium]